MIRLSGNGAGVFRKIRFGFKTAESFEVPKIPCYAFCMNMFNRLENLIGKDNLRKLQNSHVAVFGLGGVGSYVTEALVRSGIGELTIVDKDTVDETNLNRQLIATRETVGKRKTEAAAERIRSINADCKVHAYPLFYLPETAGEVDLSGVDFIVDAIDNITAKIDLAVRAEEAGIPIVSSMGTGNKMDPSCLRIADIYETSVCPLARVMRQELRKRGVGSLPVVFSTEEPRKQSSHIPASNSFVPSSAGLLLASFVVRKLIGEI